MDKIKCPFCDKSFSVLWPHLNGAHGISDMVKFKIDYPNVVLVSELVKNKQSRLAIKRGFGKSNRGKKLTKEHRAAIGRSGDKNAFYGKKHTEETKNKMRDNHADFKGDNNPLSIWLRSNPEHKIAYSNRMVLQWKKFTENKERYNNYCRVRSNISTNLILEGKVSKSQHRSGQFFSQRQDNHIIYRSSYEHKFLSLCEYNMSILSFDSCHFSIPYTFKNKQKRYIPDFKIHYTDGTLAVVEIKPSWRLKEPQNIEKFIAAKRFCASEGCTFLIITEKELFSSLTEAVAYSKSLV